MICDQRSAGQCALDNSKPDVLQLLGWSHMATVMSMEKMCINLYTYVYSIRLPRSEVLHQPYQCTWLETSTKFDYTPAITTCTCTCVLPPLFTIKFYSSQEHLMTYTCTCRSHFSTSISICLHVRSSSNPYLHVHVASTPTFLSRSRGEKLQGVSPRTWEIHVIWVWEAWARGYLYSQVFGIAREQITASEH